MAQFLAVGALAALLGPLLRRFMLPADADAGGQGQGFVLPDRRLLVFGLIAFCGLLGEGAMGDWSAVYLDQSLGADVEMAATAFAVFSLTMALGRFTGDRIVARIGGAAVVGGGGALAALGLGATLLIGRPEAAVVGFGLVGAGLSCVFPVVLSAATRMPGISAGNAIAGICTIAYLGFLIGPPVIGGVAELTSLPLALGMVVLLFVVIAAPRQPGRGPARRRDGLSRLRALAAGRHNPARGGPRRWSAGPRRSPPVPRNRPRPRPAARRDRTPPAPGD